MELEFSPHAKFSLQISPSKDGAKGVDLSMADDQEKPKSHAKEPIVFIEDHDKLEVPLVDDMIGKFA